MLSGSVIRFWLTYNALRGALYGVTTLADRALKALFSLKTLFDIVSLNVSEKLKLFDSMILQNSLIIITVIRR